MTFYAVLELNLRTGNYSTGVLGNVLLQEVAQRLPFYTRRTLQL